MIKVYLIVAFNGEGQPIKSMLYRGDALALHLRMENIAAYEAWAVTLEAFEIDMQKASHRIGQPVHTIEMALN